MIETLYRSFIEPFDLFTVTVPISVAVHMITVLSFSALPFAFQFFPYFEQFKIQRSKNSPLKTQFRVAFGVLYAQVVYQGPFIVFNYYYFKHMQIPYNWETIPGWQEVLIKLVFCLIMEDAWHYWAHRALHHPVLYKRFHKQHHEFTSPFAIQAEYAHPFETVFTGIGFFIPFAMFCNHLSLLWIWMAVRVAETTDVHSGYDIRMSPFHLLPGYGGARYHDFHHYNFEGNYAPTFVWWDWICGTDREFIEFNEKRRSEKLKEINKSLRYSTEEVKELQKGRALEIGRQVTSKYAYLVTGGNGQVGKRLVKRILAESAKRVVSLDVAGIPEEQKLKGVEYFTDDITNYEQLELAMKGIDVVIHTAALVGPFFPKERYWAVNYEGTRNVIRACRANGVTALVDCSSPSTRMDGSDILGLESSELKINEKAFVHEYAKTKALAEVEVLKANDSKLRTCAVAPHQVYGGEDRLFMGNVLKAGQSKMLRVFGDAENVVSFTNVENIAYALHLAANSLMGQNHARLAGKFYVVTDGEAQHFWVAIDEALKAVGLDSILDKAFIGKRLAMLIGTVAEFGSGLLGKESKLTRFSVRMMMNNRYFSIKEAQRDFGYEPLVSFGEKWKESAKEVYKMK